MKSYFSFLLLTLSILFSFGQTLTKELTLPNKDIQIVNNTLVYEDNPFTGKLIINHGGKADRYEGFISFKEGHLDGITDIKNDKKKQAIKFTIVNEKFDGDVIINDPEQNTLMEFRISEGIMNKMDTNISNEGIKQVLNLTFNNNLANGTMEVDDQKMDFKNGIFKLPNIPNAEMKLSVDSETGDMLAETFLNGESINKQLIPNPLVPQNIEQTLFHAIQTTNTSE